MLQLYRDDFMKKIINIYWERANLHIKLNKKVDGLIYLDNELQKIKIDNVKDSEIIISVTNTPEGEMLASGNFRISISDTYLGVDESLVKVLADKSRIFPYRNGKYYYLVDFNVDENLVLIIKTRFVVNNSSPKKFYRFCESATVLGKLKMLISVLGVFFLNVFYKIIRFFRLNNNTILFMTENSDKLTGNLRYLYEHIDKTKYRVLIYSKYKYAKKGSFLELFKATYFIGKSDIIFLDNYVQILTHVNLDKRVKLIQLWHAGVGFKSVGYARFGLEGSPHPYKSCHRKYTSIVVDDEKLIDIYQEVFGCKKDIIHPFGNPRISDYFDKEVISNVCSKMFSLNSNLKDKKTILFAPTYRGKDASSAHYDFDNIDLNKIGKFCKDNDFLFIIKLHPFIREKVDIPTQYREYILDYSEEDINDIIYISDIMITDYSSCAYEFSLFDRPLIFYRYDKTMYEYLRPMHTAEMFTSRQVEVTSFDDLLKVLKEYKNIDISKRFSNIKKSNKRLSCSEIIKQCIGD